MKERGEEEKAKKRHGGRETRPACLRFMSVALRLVGTHQCRPSALHIFRTASRGMVRDPCHSTPLQGLGQTKHGHSRLPIPCTPHCITGGRQPFNQRDPPQGAQQRPNAGSTCGWPARLSEQTRRGSEKPGAVRSHGQGSSQPCPGADAGTANLRRSVDQSQASTTHRSGKGAVCLDPARTPQGPPRRGWMARKGE